MNVTRVRTCQAFQGETPRATFEFENGSRELFVKDVAWALHCIRNHNATQKFHAGCNFTDTGDGIVISTGDCGEKISYEEADELIEEWINC